MAHGPLVVCFHNVCTRALYLFLQTENDLRGDDSDDLKVKTFSEIMAAKRQRQKRLTEKKNAELCNKKSIINNLELPHESKGRATVYHIK